MGKIRTQTGGFYYAKYQLKRSILENALVSNYTTVDQAAAYRKAPIKKQYVNKLVNIVTEEEVKGIH